MLMGAVFHNFKIQKSNPVFVTMKNATTNYNARTKGQKGHKMGTPDSWALVALLHARKAEGHHQPADEVGGLLERGN